MIKKNYLIEVECGIYKDLFSVKAENEEEANKKARKAGMLLANKQPNKNYIPYKEPDMNTLETYHIDRYLTKPKERIKVY